MPVGFSTERKAYLLFIYILNNDSWHITKKVLLLLLVLYTKQQHLEFSWQHRFRPNWPARADYSVWAEEPVNTIAFSKCRVGSTLTQHTETILWRRGQNIAMSAEIKDIFQNQTSSFSNWLVCLRRANLSSRIVVIY